MQGEDHFHYKSNKHSGSWLLSGVFFIGLIGLGILSLKQHFQIQELKALDYAKTEHTARDNSHLVNQLVYMQRQVNQQIGQSTEQMGKIIRRLDGAEEILSDLSGGICLIQGEYIFVDPQTQQPLRHVEQLIKGEEPSEIKLFPVISPETAEPTDALVLSVEGEGAPLVVEFTGTGFLVDGEGYVVTNKHVTGPWRYTQDYQSILQAGYEAQMLIFRAFFPNQPEPFELEVRAVDSQEDVALVHCDLGGSQIPVLPCVHDPGNLKTGQTVLVLGYPTGFDLLLARMDKEQLDQLLGVQGMSFEEVALKLADQNLIHPVATRGMCGRVNEGRIVYDAPTAIGGSGAPVINLDGEVVAINTALMKEFAGTNFGIPISYALELLDKMGEGAEKGR